MKFSLCLTNYNRVDLLLESFDKVLYDDRIDEIIIYDDHSNVDVVKELAPKLEAIRSPKINIIWGSMNVGMSLNKKRAIEAARNTWCILFDSDNVLNSEYITAMQKAIRPSYPKIIYCPSFAEPKFDFRHLERVLIDQNTVKDVINQPMGEVLLNTCNYVVHRDFYLNTYEHNPEMVATDTIWHNYNHLLNGGWMYVVPGATYFHRVHEGSGFLANVDYNMQMARQMRELISQL